MGSGVASLLRNLFAHREVAGQIRAAHAAGENQNGLRLRRPYGWTFISSPRLGQPPAEGIVSYSITSSEQYRERVMVHGHPRLHPFLSMYLGVVLCYRQTAATDYQFACSCIDEPASLILPKTDPDAGEDTLRLKGNLHIPKTGRIS